MRQDSYGALSSSGYGCYEDEISIFLITTALAGIAIMWWILYSKIKANGGRRKRDDEGGLFQHISLSYIQDVLIGNAKIILNNADIMPAIVMLK